MTKTFEFKTIEISTGNESISGFRKTKVPDFSEILNDAGSQGWSLVQILTPDSTMGMWAGQQNKYILIMQKEVNRLECLD